MNSNNSEVTRPLHHRLLHAAAEILLAFVFIASLFVAFMETACLDVHACQDLSSIPYIVIAGIVSLLALSLIISLWKKYRYRLEARINLDACVGVATLAIWAYYYVLVR